MSAFVALLATACDFKNMATQKDLVASQTNVTAFDDVAAFRATVYPVTTQKCASCHATSQAPYHASSSVNTAYGASLSYVNFSNAPASALVVYSGNGHCSSAVCTGDGSAMLSAVLSWINLRSQNSKPPSNIAYAVNPLVVTRGMAIANDTATFNGNPTSFAISPDLPDGLSLNAATGTISGTANILSPSTDYVVKATNSFGSSMATIKIAVNDVAPTTLTYGANPLVATKGVAIAADTPSSAGGAVVSYSVNPALPAGLVLDPSTGVISGTPSVLAVSAAYVVTATNSGGSTNASLTIQVNDVAPTALAYAANPLVATKGVQITADAPTVTGGPIVLYSVVPNLPTGLLLNAMTGVVSGTPTAISPLTAYTITATNSGGSKTAILNIQVNDAAPSGLAYSKNPLVATKGVAIAADTPSSAGGAIVSYSVNPALPTGLVLNATTGVITGTPTVLQASANYVVTATNSGGSSTATLAIAVNDAAPANLAYSVAAVTAVAGTAMTPDNPSSTGGVVTSYSVNPALPAGIVLNATTGVISGVPSAQSAKANYVVTAKNSGGSVTATVSILVNAAPPSNLAYAVNPLVATKGSAITPDTATLGSGTAMSYSVNPALPAGLVLNTTTGAISGTPTVVSPLTGYVVTVVTSGGSATATVNIQVKDVAPSNLAYSANPLVATKGSAIAADNPSSSGGAVVSYAVNPALPAGLVFNTTTGVITGTATALQASANYVVTATNSGGSATATLVISVVDVGPANLAYSVNPLVATKGVAIAADNPSNTGGAITSYSVNPALPNGLVLNATTGVITGIPTAVSGQSSYTVTGSSAAGSTSVVLKIQVNDIAPSLLSYTVNPMVLSRTMAIAANSPKFSGGTPTSYTSNPALPAGLVLNATTGVITGTPSVVAAAANYVITASNSGGAATVSLSITVNDIAPTMLAYNQAIAFYVVGTAITANSPANAGGFISTYSVNPALPAGLVLNTSSGVISGTPTAAAAAKDYVVTGSNGGGSTTATVNITSFAPNANDPNATWTYMSTNILPKCTGCHNANSKAPVVDLSTYSAVMTQVVAGKPMNSLFFTYIAPSSPEPMPLGAPALSTTDQAAVFNWIQKGAPGPAPSPSPSPTPAPSPTAGSTTACNANGMNSGLTGCGSMMTPTTYAVIARLVKVLGAAGVSPTAGNFKTTLDQAKSSLPDNADPQVATGYDQIPLLVYSACADAKASSYGVSTSATVANSTSALVAAGVAMVNAHVGNLAAAGTALNTQVTAVFTTLVNADAAAGATTAQTFISVCQAANTFGIEMTGF
ncbi:MAG: putative Ig domain-containing protein [Bdellovibrionales bacterium]|nr:putative Ig domain-containing protein [Bdellovibrionales bacterium]